MADPFIGEIRAVGFNYAPDGWVLCQGQILQVAQYQALYALLGNTYGGTAPSSFGIPDLQGRGIIGVGAGAGLPPTIFGAKVGQNSVTLSLNQMPSHNHGTTVNDPGHRHTSALPSHTHSFAIPCDNGAAAPTLSSPVNNFFSNTSGINANINVAVTDAGIANVNTNAGGPFPAVTDTPLYSASGAGSMGSGTTGASSVTAAGDTGASPTGVSVTVTNNGGSLPVSTQSPSLGMYYIMASQGIWPSKP